MSQRKVFKIGIAMAGAVSAGAYTAGVMDYLLETLDKWEHAKAKNDEIAEKFGIDHPDYDASVPMHDVIIEVMGGASAGGMTAAITALAAFEGICPVTDANLQKSDNKLYDCWVNLNDASDAATLQQMLDCKDIRPNEGVPSLLNSGPIDAIADKAAVLKRVLPLPPYLSPHLEVILTITSLRGIPISLKFSDKVKKLPKTAGRGINFVSPSDTPATHCMKLHKGIAHFKLNGDPKKYPYTIPFDPNKQRDRELLMECAKATGAFPIGLKSRLLKGTSNAYVKAMITRMFSPDDVENGTLHSNINIDTEDNPFDFVAVDGGTVNNEPFGEVMRALKDKCNENETDYAVIMIDPFPNVKNTQEKVRHPTQLLQLVPSLIGAIRGQAMVKESDILRGMSQDYTLRIIIPDRDGEDYPIACGSLDGFGGFFSRDFREHDFKLGRKNGQSFLRKYFTIPLEKASDTDIFRDWKQHESDARHKRFFIPKDETGRDGYYPIVPDMDVKDFSNDIIEHKLDIPKTRGTISVDKILQLEKKLTKRFTAVLLSILPTSPEAEQVANKQPEAIEKLIEKHYRQGLVSKQFTNSGIWIFKKIWRLMLVNQIAKYGTKIVIQTVLRDFNKRGLLDLK